MLQPNDNAIDKISYKLAVMLCQLSIFSDSPKFIAFEQDVGERGIAGDFLESAADTEITDQTNTLYRNACKLEEYNTAEIYEAMKKFGAGAIYYLACELKGKNFDTIPKNFYTAFLKLINPHLTDDDITAILTPNVAVPATNGSITNSVPNLYIDLLRQHVETLLSKENGIENIAKFVTQNPTISKLESNPCDYNLFSIALEHISMHKNLYNITLGQVLSIYQLALNQWDEIRSIDPIEQKTGIINIAALMALATNAFPGLSFFNALSCTPKCFGNETPLSDKIEELCNYLGCSKGLHVRFPSDDTLSYQEQLRMYEQEVQIANANLMIIIEEILPRISSLQEQYPEIFAFPQYRAYESWRQGVSEKISSALITQKSSFHANPVDPLP